MKKRSFVSKNGKFQSPRGTARKRRHGRRSDKLLVIVLSLIALLLMIVLGVMISQISDQKALMALADQVSRNESFAATTAFPTETVTETTRIPEDTTVTTAPPETEPVILEKYATLHDQNPDLYGWIRIDGTKIDYPVMYSPEEPERYLHRDFEKKDSYAGIPFLEDGCSSDSDNLIIYGHNMANGTMFRDLMKFEKESYWKEHPTVQFDTLYQEQEFEIIAAFYDRVYYKTEKVFKFYQFIDAEGQEDFDYAVEQFKKKSIYDTGITPQYGDQLITLVTCAYHVDNGRFVVVARRAAP